MSESAHIQVREQEANPYASGEGIRRTFIEGLNSLYQLSFLLTRDHETAERCLVAGLENLLRGNSAFNQWAHAWAKRIVIENAIRELKPRPRPSHSPLSTTDFPYIGQLSSDSGGHFEIQTILSLEDFERFVFVLYVLDHYSEQECAHFLNCSAVEIREARTRALQIFSDSLHIAFLHNQVFIQEIK